MDTNPKKVKVPVEDLRHAAARLKAGTDEVTYARILREALGGQKLSTIPPARYEAITHKLRLALALELVNKIGRPIFPIKCHAKTPWTEHGHTDATTHRAKIEQWVADKPDCNWGVIGNTIDVDNKDKPGSQTWRDLGIDGATLRAKTPTSIDDIDGHIFVLDDLPTGSDTLGPGVDTRGVNGYTVAPGSYVVANGKTVKATGFYEWRNHSAIASLLSSDHIKQTRTERGASEATRDPMVSEELAREILFAFDPDDFDDNATWEPLMMSFHYLTGGHGFATFDEWSRSGKYGGDQSNIETRFKSLTFHNQSKDHYHIIKLLRDKGRDDLAAKIITEGEFGGAPEPEEIFTAADPGSKEKAAEYADPISAAELDTMELKDEEHIIPNLCLKGWPQSCDGDAAVGKSYLWAQATVCVSAGGIFLGRPTMQTDVIFITNEDNRFQVRKRMRAQAKDIGVEFAKLPIKIKCVVDDDKDTGEIVLCAIEDNGKWTRGPYYAAFEKLCTANKGALIVLDCVNDIVIANLMLRPPSNALYKKVLQPFCKKYGVTIVVLRHPSKAAMASGAMYEGSTGNRTSIRFGTKLWLVDPTKPDGPRWFDNSIKHSYSGGSGSIKLYFDDARLIFVTDDDASVQQDQRATYDLVVKAIYELIAKGLDVTCATNGNGQTPKSVAAYINKEHKPANPITWRDVLAQMKVAEQTGALKYVKAHGNTKAHYIVPDPSEDFAS